MTPEDRRKAAIVATRRVQLEREVAFRPRCRDCRFGPIKSDEGRCEHFVHWRISPDRRLSIPETTTQARSESGLCGPEATLFAPFRGWRRVARSLSLYKGEATDFVPLACLAIGGISMICSLIWHLL